MASSLFGNNNPMQVINQVIQFMQGKNPQFIFNMMLQKNPQFAQFINQNQGKSVEQIAKENNIDINMLKSFLK